MSNNKKSKYWLDKKYKSWEENFESIEPTVTIIFYVALTIYFTFFALLLESKEGSSVIPIYGYLSAIILWVVIISGSLLIRNSGKANKKRLDNIDEKLEKLEKSHETNTQIITNLLKKMDETNTKLGELTFSINELVKRIDKR